MIITFIACASVVVLLLYMRGMENKGDQEEAYRVATDLARADLEWLWIHRPQDHDAFMSTITFMTPDDQRRHVQFMIDFKAVRNTAAYKPGEVHYDLLHELLTQQMPSIVARINLSDYGVVANAEDLVAMEIDDP